MSLFHKWRDKFLELFGIDDLLNQVAEDEAMKRVNELRRQDSERVRFEARMREEVEANKRHARDKQN